MGLKMSANTFLREMSKLIDEIEDVPIYIDGLLLITKGLCEDHLKAFIEIMKWIQAKDLQANVNKLYSAITEVSYLAYTLNQDGIKS